MAQIHYLICWDTDARKWIAADEALGAWFKDGPVWDGVEDKWRHINENDYDELDAEFDGTQGVGHMLKEMNGEG